jgi:subtilisin family serine protease
MPYRLPPYRVEATFTPLALAEIIDWGLALLHVPDHWKRTAGAGVRVALLDTGIDESHPDLAGAIDDARDFTRSKSGPADRNGHGTHVAGIVAARQNNRGVVGVAPQSRLLVAKVLGDDGVGSSAAVAAGVDWACDSGAHLLSMSLGSPQPDPALHAAIKRAVAKGVFVITAAGNAGRADSVNYPARWRETVAVAAVDKSGRLSRFSSRGPQVDIAAPGQDVLSTYVGGGYAKLSGTSMAAPFVAGIVALLIPLHRDTCNSRTPLRTLADLHEHLRRTARDAGPVGHDPGYGWGLINPDKLLGTTAHRLKGRGSRRAAAM